jgi:transposase
MAIRETGLSQAIRSLPIADQFASRRMRNALASRTTTGGIELVENITVPAYSPELNPVENIWQYLRQNQLSNRVFDNYDAIVEACCDAWNALTAQPGRIHSIATRPWASASVTR